MKTKNNELKLTIHQITLLKSNNESLEDILSFSTDGVFTDFEQKCSDYPKYIYDGIKDAMKDITHYWSSFTKMKKDPRFIETYEFVDLYNQWGNEAFKTAKHCRKIPWDDEKFKQFVYDIESLPKSEQDKIIKSIKNAFDRTKKDVPLYKYTSDFDKYLDSEPSISEGNKVKSENKKRITPFIQLNTNLERLMKRHNL